VCNALFDEAEHRAELGIKQCDVPVAKGTEIGLPHWSVVNPLQNLAVVKKILAWDVARGNLVTDSQDLYVLLRKNESSEFEASEAIWQKHSRNLMDLVARHDIRLEVAEVQLVVSLPPFQIYRMTYLEPEYTSGHIESWSVDACNAAETRKWQLYYGLRPAFWAEYVALNSRAIGPTDLLITKHGVFQAYLDTPAGVTLLGFTSFDEKFVNAKPEVCEIKIKR